MPNWLRFVEYTAEFTPGVWSVEGPAADEANRPVAVQTVVNGITQLLAVVHRRRTYTTAELADGARYDDDERDANARLMADAPLMLVILASLMNAMDAMVKDTAIGRELLDAHRDGVCDVLRRHVRIGCAPVDAESRAKPSQMMSVEELIAALNERSV